MTAVLITCVLVVMVFGGTVVAARAVRAQARPTAELESERFLVELYGPQGALLREAIRSGKVSQFIVDPNGRITVPPAAQR